MSGSIEAVYIFDELSRPLLSHVYTARPLAASTLIQLYQAHPTPRPPVVYLPTTVPPTLVFSLVHGNLLFIATASAEIEPLLAIEFLHRLVDILEDFVGAPLISLKIENSYEVVAQLLNEMCDGGAVNTTEGNALRDTVEVEGWIGKLLGGINIPGKPGFASSNTAASSIIPTTSNTPTVPWRRANVRHTSNELYVDLVETLSVVFAPSGRPLSAFANGTIAFTSKISGVPDLLLTLSAPSGKQNIGSVMELPVFHPCVRLGRWRERPGELSFIPPDGRFVLAGYEVDLLPFTNGKPGSTSAANLNLPMQLELKTGLGPLGADFEIRLFVSKLSGMGASSGFGGSSSRMSNAGTRSMGGGGSSSPAIEELVVTVPIPATVRNITDIRASRGETTYNPGETQIQWQLPTRGVVHGTATLRCTVMGPLSDLDRDDAANGFATEAGDYNYQENAYQATSAERAEAGDTSKDPKRVAQNKTLMPSSATLSFSIAGWLPSGIKVDSLMVDTKKSRGLGEGVKPYKGVKYLTVSRGGVEVRG